MLDTRQVIIMQEANFPKFITSYNFKSGLKTALQLIVFVNEF